MRQVSPKTSVTRAGSVLRLVSTKASEHLGAVLRELASAYELEASSQRHPKESSLMNDGSCLEADDLEDEDDNKELLSCYTLIYTISSQKFTRRGRIWLLNCCPDLSCIGSGQISPGTNL